MQLVTREPPRWKPWVQCGPPQHQAPRFVAPMHAAECTGTSTPAWQRTGLWSTVGWKWWIFFCFLDVIAVIVTTIQWLQEPLGQWDRYVLQKDILLQGHTALRKCLWVWHMATGYPWDEAAAELVRMSPTDVCSWPSVADVGEQKCPWRWKLLELLLSLSWIRFWWWKWRGFWQFLVSLGTLVFSWASLSIQFQSSKYGKIMRAKKLPDSLPESRPCISVSRTILISRRRSLPVLRRSGHWKHSEA